MPNINEGLERDSEFLKWQDLTKKEFHNVQIDHVEHKVIRQDEKPVFILHFRGAKKCLPLNVTNQGRLKQIADACSYGENTDHYGGLRVVLYVDYEVRNPQTGIAGGVRLDVYRSIQANPKSEMPEPTPPSAGFDDPPATDEEPPPPTDEPGPFDF